MYTHKSSAQNFFAVILAISLLLVPTLGFSQSAKQKAHRQQTKNQWRNIGYAAGAVGLYGLLKGNSTLALFGLAGGLYSASRYEHDRKSQNHNDRRRAAYFSRQHVTRSGHRYTRRTVIKHGHKYYAFVKDRH